MTSERWRWVTLLAILVGVPVVDLALGPDVNAGGSLVAIPLIAWTLVGPVRTAVAAVVAVVVALFLIATYSEPWTDENIVRIAVLTVVGAIAVAFAVRRRHQEEEIAALLDARAEADAAADRIGHLQRISEAGLSHLNVDDLLAAMLAELRDGFRCDAATVLLLDDDRRGLVVRASVGFLDEMEAGTVVPVGRGLVGRVAEVQEPVLLNDLRRADVSSPILSRSGLRAFVAAPLLLSGGGTGVIWAGDRSTGHFGAEHVRRLQDIAARVSLALDRSRLFQAARERDAMTQAVLDTVEDAIMTIDDAGRITMVNPGVERTFGYQPEELVGELLSLLLPESARSHDSDEVRHLFEVGDGGVVGVGLESIGRRKSGELFPLEISMSEMAVNGQRTFVGSLRDVSERKEAERRLTQAALHDPLTGLANRSVLTDRLHHALATARRRGGVVALLFLDLDRFKRINDSMGHDAGDLLLCTVADRLAAAIRTEDLLVRLGGDEFVVMCEALERPDDAMEVAERLRAALTAPVKLADAEVFVSASIGIALSTDAVDPSELLRTADAAMYRVKEHGRDGAELYDETLQNEALARLRLEGELRGALSRGELVLHYQPLLDLRSGAVAGAEALLRWQHPARGLLEPAAFLREAETAGLMVDIGTWVLREACREAARWQSRAGEVGPSVWVNLSGRELAHPQLLDRVREALDESGLAPKRLRLEVTEGLLMQDTAATARTLEALHDVGVLIAVDDFGTGYSSLAYLRSFRVDTLKLDRSFLAELDRGADRSIIEAVAGLAEGLGITVLAEGVERAGQLDALCEAGYHLAQGFHLGRPVTGEQLVDLRTGVISLHPGVRTCDPAG